MKVKDKFIRYIKIDTQSNPDSNSNPSSNNQFELAKKLVTELENLGLNEIIMTDKCYVTATLPSNTDKNVPVIAFIAHLDTSPDTSGKNVEHQIIENYDGNDIILNTENNIILSPSDFPILKNYIGKTLITTKGKTLLGADNKAGIAEIMTAIQYLTEHPEVKHGKIKIGFTPDEEIGRGADNFDVKKFGADFAYTVDGGEIGELEYENFNAASLSVTINGRNIHPGTAKNLMINSIQIANDFHNKLPKNERPENTEAYEGFFHLLKMSGTVDLTKMQYIIRDHDLKKFEKKKELAKKNVDSINSEYNKEIISVEIKDTYFNMKEKIEPVYHIVELAKEAMIEAEVEPKISPIRGGTDGARLSYMGLPCPNIFTGGHNFHGLYEFIPVESMEKAVEVIINISKNIVNKN
jgi:tripeptide aminopeptidase